MVEQILAATFRLSDVLDHNNNNDNSRLVESSVRYEVESRRDHDCRRARGGRTKNDAVPQTAKRCPCNTGSVYYTVPTIVVDVDHDYSHAASYLFHFCFYLCILFFKVTFFILHDTHVADGQERSHFVNALKNLVRTT
nr:hypothetical protein CFP56_30685 [Quercus suber]